MNILPLNEWIPNLKHPLIIAGPCSAESEQQVLETAKAVEQYPNVKIFRAGIWKPRTRPTGFEGIGEIGLNWLKKVKAETRLLTGVEVANAKHVELCLEHGVDVLWIGARTTVNPFSMQEIADCLKGVDVPILVKNPINPDLSLWIGGLERINKAGIRRMAAIHRGFSSFEKTRFRNDPLWKIPVELKCRFPQLPIICDPSHITGKRELIAPVCQKAMDLNFDGLMIETHPRPDEAWTDASQQITPGILGDILESLVIPTTVSSDKSFEAQLDELRSRIDRIDREIILSLGERMKIVNEIGKAKAEQNITALQISRWDEVMKKLFKIGQSVSLRDEYIKAIYDVVHDESVRVQSEILLDANKKISQGVDEKV